MKSPSYIAWVFFCLFENDGYNEKLIFSLVVFPTAFFYL